MSPLVLQLTCEVPTPDTWRRWVFSFGAGPDGGDGHELREVDGVKDRPPDVGVDVAGVRAEPGVAGVERFVLHREPPALNRPA